MKKRIPEMIKLIEGTGSATKILKVSEFLTQVIYISTQEFIRYLQHNNLEIKESKSKIKRLEAMVKEGGG